VVCGTPFQVWNGSEPSNVHSSTVNRLRWHRKMEQTCHHIWPHDTHHTSDHLKHRASPQPVIDVSYIITESKENPIPYMR